MAQIKKAVAHGSGRLVPPEEPASTNDKSPVFCFRYLVNGYSLAECGHTDAAAFLAKLKSLCDLTWQTIQNSNRRGQGHEKIPIAQLRCARPQRATEDVKELLCFRFPGEHPARFLGLRHGRVFEVYIIDAGGQVYSHE